MNFIKNLFYTYNTNMPHKSEDLKISAVEYYLDSNKIQDAVCNIFKCSVRSLMRWVERYENEDSIKRHHREPISYKIKKNMLNLH